MFAWINSTVTRMAMAAFKYILLSNLVLIPHSTSTENPLPDLTQHANWPLLNDDACGINVIDRIIGGINATMGQYPWIARLGYLKSSNETEYRCGGTLINKMYILTAGHCVSNLPPGTTLRHIRLGEFNTLTPVDCDENKVCAEPLQDMEVDKIILHNTYNPAAFKDDIALIRLKAPVVYNGWVAPLCPVSGLLIQKTFVGEFAEVAGWGTVDITTKKGSTILQAIKLPVVDMTLCKEAFRRLASVGTGQMCVGGVVGMDSCTGDSGGPLMKPESNGGPPRYFHIGIVSFGAKYCGKSMKPAIYTRVADYMGWILNTIAP